MYHPSSDTIFRSHPHASQQSAEKPLSDHSHPSAVYGLLHLCLFLSKVEQNLIVQGIMDAEGLSLDDDDIQTLKDELLSEYGYESFDQLVAYYGEQEVNESLALMRVERFIVDNATVNETSATEADVANEDADPESENTGVDAAEDTTEDNASEEDSSDTAEESEETASEDDVANEG